MAGGKMTVITAGHHDAYRSGESLGTPVQPPRRTIGAVTSDANAIPTPTRLWDHGRCTAQPAAFSSRWSRSMRSEDTRCLLRFRRWWVGVGRSARVGAPRRTHTSGQW